MIVEFRLNARLLLHLIKLDRLSMRLLGIAACLIMNRYFKWWILSTFGTKNKYNVLIKCNFFFATFNLKKKNNFFNISPENRKVFINLVSWRAAWTFCISFYYSEITMRVIYYWALPNNEIENKVCSTYSDGTVAQ